ALLALRETPSATTSDAKEAPLSSRVNVSFRVALGEEWDTNARRVITGNVGILEGASLPSGPVVGDALTRLLADTQASFKLAPDHVLNLGYVLGAKRFYQYGSEDLLVHDLSFGSTHAFTDWLTLASWGTFRASRIRSGTRDYSLGTLGLGA